MGKHPELQAKVITPDILVNPHFASLEMTFYEGSQFPAEFKGDGFACEHGSWNRAQRSGYEVIRLPMRNGQATGEYEDFLTGFTVNNADGDVWGRPVGLLQLHDGSMLVSDDGEADNAGRAVGQLAPSGRRATNGVSCHRPRTFCPRLTCRQSDPYPVP